jgi:hypothetical protein
MDPEETGRRLGMLDVHLRRAPADTNVGHILPLCFGGPGCGCNFQLLTTAEHKLKTKEYDLPACSHFKVKI